MAKKNRLEEFNQFYQSQYQDRWPSLSAAMMGPKKYVAMMNPQISEFEKNKLSSTLLATEFLDGYFLNEAQDVSIDCETNLKNFYPLDFASLYPAHELLKAINQRPELNPSIADLCAAPGGKSLYLLFHLKKWENFYVNEISSSRRQRLKQNLRDYLAETTLSKIQITHFDSKSWCLTDKEKFDFILLDAPCSSERHYLLNSQKTKIMDEWSPSRSKKMSQDQFALICSAYLLLRPGGHLVYSTCSISHLENDQIIAKILKKHQNSIEVLKQDPATFLEPTEFGSMILPDQFGYGPIFFSHLIKNS
ncbi:MAG: hypothetical protein QE271_03870 [Bacteriovoracaceae bacterium]|nr:hypothetical protein [Bacteriovoracaceae bacterium]